MPSIAPPVRTIRGLGQLGTWGMIVAALLMVISPYMLYYGRYVRNESFVGFSGILLLYSILRYLESGEKKYIYFVTLATVLYFTSKETAFIYTAQALLFLGFVFLYRITKTPWAGQYPAFRTFVILLAAGALLVSLGLAAMIIPSRGGDVLSVTETAAPANPTDGLSTDQAGEAGGISLSSILLELGILGIAAGVHLLPARIFAKRDPEGAIVRSSHGHTHLLPAAVGRSSSAASCATACRGPARCSGRSGSCSRIRASPIPDTGRRPC